MNGEDIFQGRNGLKPSQSEVLRVVREHTCYELAEHCLLKVEASYRPLLEALNCGVQATRAFLTMYAYRRE